MKTHRNQQTIGSIGNHYGSLSIRQTNDGAGWEWGIENWDGTDWEKIPDYLAEALLEFENNEYS